jgi:PadR family transcriptional regulator PadR
MIMNDTESWKIQMYKGLSELALLSLLRRRAHYGLELLTALRDEAAMDVSEGSIYPLLHRLEKAGWIGSEWRHEASATHPRKYYKLSQEGEATCTRMTQEWQALVHGLAHVIGENK